MSETVLTILVAALIVASVVVANSFEAVVSTSMSARVSGSLLTLSAVM